MALRPSLAILVRVAIATRTTLAVILAVCVPLASAFALEPFAQAEKIIKDHRLLTPQAQRCTKLVLRDDSNKRVAKIGVYEIHDETCGGDPEVEHRLFDLEINARTGTATWDYDSPDGEMRPVPKRR